MRSAWIATDGGPLLLVPHPHLSAWNGSYVAGTSGDFVIETSRGMFSFRTQYDFDNPRTDYERACATSGRVAAMPHAGSHCLVLGDEPLECCWCPQPDGGVFAQPHTVEPGADVDAELRDLLRQLSTIAWTDEHLSIEGGSYALIDALDHGAALQRPPVAVELAAPSPFRVLSAMHATPDVRWVLVRLVR